MDQLEYQAYQANLVVKEISETKAQLENLVEMAKMDFVDLKVTQVNQVHKVCQEDKVEMEWLDPQVQLVPWSKVKKFQVLLDNQALMESLEVLVGQEDQAHLDKLVLLEPLEKMENLDENTARMISEKFVPQSYETACLNLLLDYQDLLEDLVVDIV